MSATDRPDSAVEEISIDDKLLQLGGEPSGPPDPNWAWCLLRVENDPPRQIWVRYPVEEIPPSALCVRAARAPSPDDDGVVVVTSRRIGRAESRRESRDTNVRRDPNLLTVSEFAERIGIAESSVFELINKGLPSFSSKHVGRRIKLAQAMAWLEAGGASRSRIAKRLAKAKAVSTTNLSKREVGDER
jgi:hypothetical protein